MNIFVLDLNPQKAAKMHCDAHVRKMIVESAQMLSTAHRVLDGTLYEDFSKSGKRIVKKYRLPQHKNHLYEAAYVNHPCTAWVRESIANYQWLYDLFCCLCDEYKKMSAKTHATDTKLRTALAFPPNNIPNVQMTPFAHALSGKNECIVKGDIVQTYRNFYHADKARFATWKNREVPYWWNPHKQ